MPRPQRVELFALITALYLSSLGCASKPRQPVAQSPPPQPTTVPARPIEIRYGTYLKTDELTPEQHEEVIAAANDDLPPGRQIWLILIDMNYLHEGKRQYSGVVYYTPDATSARLRRGRATMVESSSVVLDKRRYIKRRKDRRGYPPLGEYVQVSFASAPFGNKLDVPHVGHMPFAPPHGISDADLIQIVDAARAAYDATRASKPPDPICRIETQDLPAGEVRVFFGYQAGPFSGEGSFAIVRKKGKEYEADPELGQWKL